jgi:1,4-alpha-glucan branching enzyme
MVDVAREPRQRSELEARALNQAARELLLAQSSDWAFIMSQGTTVAYAVRRTEEHLRAFNALLDMVQQRRVDARALAELEARNNVFPRLDFRAYGPTHAK